VQKEKICLYIFRGKLTTAVAARFDCC